MNFILIAIVAGSLVVSGHDTKEACLGRAAILKEQKIAAECHSAPSPLLTSGSLTLSGPTYSYPGASR